ncbi:MAG TPA: hypothetical protein VGF97_10370 [Rhizomicrobium sp.]|jgi:hypothetical protein
MTISRRHLFRSAALTAGTLVTVAAARSALARSALLADDSSDSSKPSKSAAGYQDGPNGDQRCSVCAHFTPPTDCQVIAGRVTPTGWCHLFQAKNA